MTSTDMGMPPPDLASQAGSAEPPSANDITTTGNDLSPLVLRGLLLTIVTLGIYRFWYKTDLRRWYWRNTVIGGSALEYRGTAKELFIGFLIALAVVMPLYGLSFVLALFVTETVDLALKPVLALVFVLLVQYGAYRSRRYRLTRTVWRGLRFDQTGSAVIYALKSLGWLLVTMLTVGLAFPWMRLALERYRIEHTHFGSAKGSFEASAWPLLKSWLILLLPAILLLFVGVYQAIDTAVWIQPAKHYQLFRKVAGMIALAIIWPFLLWPAYHAQELRVFTGATKLGPVSFVSALETRELYKLYFKLFGGMAVGILVIGLLTVMIVPLFSWVFGPVGAAVALVIPYLASFLLLAWLKEIIFSQGFWRHAVARLGINNLAAADEVLGSAVRDEAATGEGFADALDFGGV